MRKEAALIVGAIMAVLAALGVVVTPEQYEAIEAVVLVIVSLGGTVVIREFVASRFSVEKKAGKEAYQRVFEGKKGPNAKRF